MSSYTHIIETSANQLCAVRVLSDPNLAHCWFGVEVKRSKGAFIPKASPAGRTPHLIRRECTKIIQLIN